MGNRKEVSELVKVTDLFRDTDEGVTVLYEENGTESGVLLWSVGNDYGSVEARIITIGGTIWDNPLKFGVRVRNWEGEGELYDEDFEGAIDSFKDLVESAELVTKYVLNILGEDIYIAK
jgi:hypothetical protein